MSLIVMAAVAAARQKLKMLYNLGVEVVAWVAGHAYGDYIRSKNADHLYLNAMGNSDPLVSSEVAYVTDATQNLTNYSKLKIDWMNDGSVTSGNHSILVASTNKTANWGTYDACYFKQSSFSRQIDEVDISGLSGDFYVRVHAYMTAEDFFSVVKVYKVWLE